MKSMAIRGANNCPAHKRIRALTGLCLAVSAAMLLTPAGCAANYSSKTGRQAANSSTYQATHNHSSAQPKGKAKNNSSPAPKPKSPEQMMQMLDDLENSPPLSNASKQIPISRSPAPAGGYSRGMLSRQGFSGMSGGLGAGMRSPSMHAMPAGNSSRLMLNNLAQKIQAMRQGGPGQPPMMQMLQQQMQGGGGAPPQFGQMLQQGMQGQPGQSQTGGAMSPLMQKFAQSMSGMNSGMASSSQSNFGGNRLPPPSSPNLLQKARMMSGSRNGQFGGFPAQSQSSGATNGSAQDLQKQLEEQYGN